MERIDVTIQGVSLTVVGSRTKEFRGSREEPPEPSYFEIERIEHEGEDIVHLLSDEALAEIDEALNELGECYE
jgi:hypothetical protein